MTRFFKKTTFLTSQPYKILQLLNYDQYVSRVVDFETKSIVPENSSSKKG